MKRRIMDLAVVVLGTAEESAVQLFVRDNRGAVWSLLAPDADDTPDAWERLPDLPQDDA